MVASDACGEGVQAGQVVSPDGIDPFGQPLALALGEHLGEGPDMSGEGLEFGAAGQDGFEPEGFALGEGFRAAEDPPGHRPVCRWLCGDWTG
ncbi:hypothetical protein [Streptomyces sp. NPDC052721]|uniref:hypothetical protein n=1 Tax=Streptomyces sp. NPDC052721 TaxID=3154955 RepID=UPI00342F4E87